MHAKGRNFQMEYSLYQGERERLLNALNVNLMGDNKDEVIKDLFRNN